MKKICFGIWRKIQTLFLRFNSKDNIVLPQQSIPLSQVEYDRAVLVCDYISN